MVVLGGGAVSYERDTPVQHGPAYPMVVLGGGGFVMSEAPLQGYLAHMKPPPPWDRHRSLGTVQLYGPMGWRFLASEVTL